LTPLHSSRPREGYRVFDEGAFLAGATDGEELGDAGRAAAAAPPLTWAERGGPRRGPRTARATAVAVVGGAAVGLLAVTTFRSLTTTEPRSHAARVPALTVRVSPRVRASAAPGTGRRARRLPSARSAARGEAPAPSARVAPSSGGGEGMPVVAEAEFGFER
jgi:hypothetical protein